MQNAIWRAGSAVNPFDSGQPLYPNPGVRGHFVGLDNRSGRTVKAVSSWAQKLDRVMRDVFVKIGKDQKQFKHSITLVLVRTLQRIFQIIHDHERIGEKPFQRLCVDSLPNTAALKCLVCPDKGFIQEMIETESFGD